MVKGNHEDHEVLNHEEAGILITRCSVLWTNVRAARAMLFTLALLSTGGCTFSQDAGGIADQLTWASNRMNLFGGDERTVVFSPASNDPYWIVIVPGGASRERLATFGYPESVSRTFLDCSEAGRSVIVLVEGNTSSCVEGAEFPEHHVMLGVAKQSKEETRFTIRRNGRALEVVAMQ